MRTFGAKNLTGRERKFQAEIDELKERNQQLGGRLKEADDTIEQLEEQVEQLQARLQAKCK